ncbi:MAG TPA: hypothetical protein VGN69_01425 [Solirubrobacteraceae bacterium]|nr:hypothetical protein [Solirubrobacteraceae bacterium]
MSATLVLGLALVGVAVADTPGPPDSSVTPQAADPGTSWSQIAGAAYPETKVPASSPTAYDVDFYAVRFFDDNNGFAAGSVCDAPDHTGDLTSCPADKRRPVIYQYTNPVTGQPRWSEVYRGRACDSATDTACGPGFVSAIAYIGRGRALAVGGTGTFPGRESPTAVDDPAYSDPAGHGRVWLYDHGSWQELPPSQLISAPNGKPMRGLTSVDCSPRAEQFCVAGGLQQLFMWRDGRFEKSYSNESPDYGRSGVPNPRTEVEFASQFRFRVRELRFVPGGAPVVQVVAVTSGCCATAPTDNLARVLFFDGARWYVRPLYAPANGGSPTDTATPQTVPDSYFGLITGTSSGSLLLSVLTTPGGPASPSEPASRVLGNVGPDDPSTGSFSPVQSGVSLLVADPLDILFGGQSAKAEDLTNEAAHPVVSGTRLVAGDGDLSGPPGAQPASSTSLGGGGGGPDHYMDWAVGGFSSGSEPGRAVAYTTTTVPHAVNVPNPTSCPDPYTNPSVGCSVSAGNATKSPPPSFFRLPSYALNSFQLLDSGIGWGVGDKGAIMRLGGGPNGSTGDAGSEPLAPSLGAHDAAGGTDGTAFDAFRPPSVTGEPGTVPPLATQPAERGASPRLTGFGSPDLQRSAFLPEDDVSSIVMSKDGSEGWALGAGIDNGTPARRTTLYHFTGAGWLPCAFDPSPGLPADPACVGLSRLLHYVDSTHAAHPTPIYSVARVPYEGTGGSDSNRFDLVAVGGEYRATPHDQPHHVVLRYRDGRWAVDDQATAEINAWIDKDQSTAPGAVNGDGLASVAFTAPDDGWIATRDSDLFHFDGHHWTSCRDDPAGCGDDAAHRRLPAKTANAGDVSLTAVGDRVYLRGARRSPDGSIRYPMIIYHPHQGHWTDGGDGSGNDPGCASYDLATGACIATANAPRGTVESLSLARNGDGSMSGWATTVSDLGTAVVNQFNDQLSPSGTLLHLAHSGPDKYAWQTWTAADASAEYGFALRAQSAGLVPSVLTLPGATGEGQALLLPTTGDLSPVGPLLRFDPAKGGSGRWGVASTPFAQPSGSYDAANHPTDARGRAVAPDGHGGAWLVFRRMGGESGFGDTARRGALVFYHYSPVSPKPVFADVPHPIREPITSMAGAPDGRLWVITTSSTLYHYDRLTGWDQVRVSGWDPGRLVTSASPAYAVAVGPDGQGLAVGKGGRIADLTGATAHLDATAGAVRCVDNHDVAPCATGNDLHSAAIGPDGSAMVGGDRRTVLFRPAGGEFRGVAPPQTAASAQITAISMPHSGQAWLATSTGQIFAGTLTGSGWSWTLEDTTPAGDLLARGDQGQLLAIHSISLDAAGHGFAVGDQGLILRRDPGSNPWSRLGGVPLSDLYSVALPAGGGPGAIVGGEYGLILTYEAGRFQVARNADPWDGVSNTNSESTPSKVPGVALLAGTWAGEVEAWAALQAPVDSQNRTAAPSSLLHYTSAPAEPLLSPLTRVMSLSDTPAPRPGELTFSTFGKSECHSADCPEPADSNRTSDLISRTIAQRIAASAGRDGGPAFSLYTGDAVNAAGHDQPRVTDIKNALPSTPVVVPSDPTVPSVAHERWADFLMPQLAGSGPLFAAVGGQDLSRTQADRAGSNVPWRKALASMPAPWGASGAAPPGSHGISFVPVVGAAQDDSVNGGAHTHYAVDINRGGATVARLIVLDTSLRTLATAEGTQNPVESQTTWLKDTLASTPAHAQKVVLSETPAYSYGPGAGTDTQTDAAAFETILSQYKANLVVSGRLGWNGLYWATAPGLHTPCAGDSYPDPTQVPSGATQPSCAAAGGAPSTPDAASQVATSLLSAAAPGAPTGCQGDGENTSGVLPTVVASSAGGKFGPDGQAAGTADTQGFWHGYTVVRLDKSGDPRCTIVEQRPVFDWVGIQAAAHVLRPGQHVTLKGYGREPVGSDQPILYDAINGPAITHRYDLLRADPQRPYLPATSCPKTPGNPAGYCELSDPTVGSIDPVAGKVTTGRGNHPRVYAIGLLSVGDKAASWPLVFEPRRSFVAVPPTVTNIPALPAPPQVHVAAIGGTSPPPPPSAPPPAPPSVGTPTLPQLPGLPGLPPLNAPPPAAPPPPAGAPPPAPSASQAPSALSISVSPQSVGFAPPSGVVPPPAPPINPAPPGGARREAKAKQPAAAKSEESGASDKESLAGDPANAPPQEPGYNMTRREPPRSAPSYTFVGSRQPSAWSRDALYGGGLVLTAAILALGFTTVRPTPRRRTTIIPAPARSSTRRRRG